MARRVKPDLSLFVMRDILPHFHPEYMDRYIDGLRKAGLPELSVDRQLDTEYGINLADRSLTSGAVERD